MMIESHSYEQTFEIARQVAKNARAGDVVALSGDLGVGKTVFAKGFAHGLGIDEPITSPTFTLINEYFGGDLPFYHFDVYRLGDADALADMGGAEYLRGYGVCLVEWAEMAAAALPPETLWVTIEKDLAKGENYRKIKISQGEIMRENFSH